VNAVLDTNVLVSALWSADSKPAQIVSMVISGDITPCYNADILIEYKEVLSRDRLGFSADEVNSLMTVIENRGLSVAEPMSMIPFSDEDDRKFYDVAVFCGAKVITGNLKHYPSDGVAIAVSEFLDNQRTKGLQ
jgi:putative PIN family toxin of toxin-antitoxin system